MRGRANPRDLVPGLLFLGFGAWLLYESGRLDVVLARDVGGGMNAAAYPRLLAIALLAGAAMLLWRALRPGSQAPSGPSADGGPALSGRAGAAMLSFLLFALLLERLGFVLAAALLLAALMAIAGERRWPVLITLPVAMALTVQIVTRLAFDIVLPRGVLRFLPW